MSIRPVKRLIKSKPTLEGAGVHLRRAFGFGNTAEFDPFLLLDDFRNDVPEDYLAGFPWHPHRGIETVTYVLAGTVEHGDSMGNHGAIAAGDVQWMTAGSGIIHQEMPKGDTTGPNARVSTLGESARRAQDDRAALSGSEGAARFRRSPTMTVRTCALSAGASGERRGRWTGLQQIRSISMFPYRRASERCCRSKPPVTRSHTCSRVTGSSATRRVRWRCRPKALGWLDTRRPPTRRIALWSFSIAGDEVSVQAGEDGIRFLLVSGKPLQEPVAWYGPIVMNTQQELQQAFNELEKGTFLKK